MLDHGGGGVLTNQQLLNKSTSLSNWGVGPLPVTKTSTPTTKKTVTTQPSTWGINGYPTVTQPQPGYTGPLNNTQGPYIPGVSNNPAAVKTTSGANLTQNKTFFPGPTGGVYDSRGVEQFPTSGGTGGGGGGGAPRPGDMGYVAPDGYTPPGTPSAQDILKEIGRGTNPQYQQMNDIINGANAFTYQDTAGPRPEMRSAADMARHMGINHDMDYMRGIYDDATKAQYANLDKEHERGQGMFYRDSARMATDLNSALMRGDRSAAMTGASRGSQVAEQLAAMQGMSEAGTMTATQLAQDRASLVGEREAALAKNAQKALADFNSLGIDLGNLSNSELNALTQAYAAEVAKDSQMGSSAMNASALLKGNALSNIGHMYGADTNLAGTQYSADSNLTGVKIKDATDRANIAANSANEANRNATNLSIAQKQAEAQVKAAGIPYNHPQYSQYLNAAIAQLSK